MSVESHVEARSGLQLSSASSESSESIDSDPERQLLIPTNTDQKAPNYKSTITQDDTEPDEEEAGSSEEEPTSKSVLAIISLLLIGTSHSALGERMLLT